MAEPVRLNLGCHQWRLKGFVNIDIDPDFAYDLQADVLALPYGDNSVDEIYAGHMLEHTTPKDEALKEWSRVLKPGGLITITVPDTKKSLAMYEDGQMDLTWLTRVVYGSDERHEQLHYQLFTEEILLQAMRPHFPDAEIIPRSDYAVANVPWQSIGTGHKPK